jgi:butyrate kinase
MEVPVSAEKTFRMLVINPGSTSTKVGVFENEHPVCVEAIEHAHTEMAAFPRIPDQYAFRRDAVLGFLQRHGIAVSSMHAIVGRGGLLRPLESGTYAINQRMLDELRNPVKARDHVVNLGALITNEIAAPAGIPAYIVDPVCVDELEPVARIAGLPEIERASLSHVLSLKAAARRAAKELGRPYAELNLVVVHMGGGISVAAHQHGRQIDVNQALDGTGPFSPERVGGLPVGDVLRLAFSGKYTYEELFRRFTRQGGLLAHLGTNDAREVQRRIAQGDEQARLVYMAMAYQIAKEIGLMATTLCAQPDAIVLTGGLAKSQMLVGWIRQHVGWIAPLVVYPGEDELLALAQGALRVLRGEEPVKEY